MDITNVLQAITLCVKAQNQEDITKGQTFLAASAIEPGYPLKLMMIADMSDLEVHVRQFAVTDLKNSITKYWRAKKDKPSFSEEDKATVRNNLLDALIRSVENTKLSKMYTKIILDVCAYDFPAQWPNIVELAIQKLSTSENQNEIYACCLALQQVFTNLQFEMQARETLEHVITVVFPTFQTLIAKLMGIYNADTAYLLKPILRSFYASINIDMPKYLQSTEALSQWINFIKLLLDSQMPANLTSPTQNEDVIINRDKQALWKNKKWASRILTKLIQRYANKKIASGQNMKDLVQWLIDTHLGGVMQSFVNQLVRTQTEFVGSAVVHFGIKYLIRVCKHQSLFEAFQPYIETVLYESIFPMLFLTPKDSELWESDPSEFIRQEDDFFGGNMRNNKNIAMDLVGEIAVNSFTKNTYLHQFIQFCVTCIETNVNPRTNAPITLAIKDGIFFAFGQLKSQILEDEQVSSQIETLLEKYILPQLNNPNAFIRARSCWVFGKYGFIEFKNNQNIITAVNGITACMKDENLPVKFKAALALNCLIKQTIAQEMVKAYLSEILRIYLKLMDEIDSEELVAALEGIVNQFSQEIGPFAYDLCLHLSQAFYKYREKDNDADNDDDGECQLAAGGCLDAIGKILGSPITPDVLVKLEEVILPMLNHCLADERCDYMEESLHLLQQMVHKAVVISSESQLWFYYPVLIYIVIGRENANLNVGAHLNDGQKLILESSVNGWGPEYLNEIVIILKNFIQKGGDFFMSAVDLFGTRFIELMFEFVASIYQKVADGTMEDDEESCMKNCLCVFYSLIENHVTDQKISGAILQQVIQVTLQNLSRDKLKNDVLVANLETLCLCFYYNAQETFGVLINSFGVAIVNQLFQRWFSLQKSFKSDFANQRLLLAYASILAVQGLPEEILALMPTILKQSVAITSEIVHLREEEEFEDDEDDDEDNEEAENSAAIGQMSGASSTAASKNKGNVAAAIGGGNEAEDDDLSIDSDFDPMDKYHYNYCYECPLENVDEIIVLEQKLMTVAQANQAYYNAITQLLTEQDKQKLQENIAYSKKQYEEYLQSKQNEKATA